MHRIDTSTAQVDKFGAGKNGFTAGNPQTGELPTALDEMFFDSVQEEISGVIESAGLVLDKQKNDQLTSALKKLFLQTGNNFSEIKTAGAAAQLAARGNLALDTAATRAVGSGANQIPDMSLFASNQAATGYQKLPGGLIIQWGTTGFSAASTGIATTTFPIMFPNACLQISLTEMTTISGSTPYTGVNAWGSDTTLTTTGFSATCANRISQAAAVAEAARYIAIGY